MDEIDILMNAPDEGVEAYLDRACGEDHELRRRVESLIKADSSAGSFMGRAVVRDDLEEPAGSAPLEPGLIVGNYKLVERIGEGGFGIVYRAEQLAPVRRTVAFKVIKLGMDTEQVVARFEAERQALAMMDHPGIAKVHDAGATDSGRPFFVMELVDGISITSYCEQEKLDNDARLQLFVDVCLAVQHAHQKGIIHRDLKPSNILVSVHDGKPVPKVIDFGVAKATQGDQEDVTLFTRLEQFIGTPAYMSPEQAGMSGVDIDTRSDIYSLGVLLYELLTGTTPFGSKVVAEASQDELRRMIREDDPPKPSTRIRTALRRDHTHGDGRFDHRRLHGDLDWIVMKALEKDRQRRYDTANGLAEDIGRHLRDEAVLAAAPSARYRIGKFVRRNRAFLATAGGVGLILLVATIFSGWKAVEAQRAEKAATAARDDARWAETVAQHQLAEELLAAGDTQLGVAHLARLIRRDRGNRIAAERLMSALTYREFARPAVEPLHGASLITPGFSPDGAKIVAHSPDSRGFQVWDVETRTPLGDKPMHMEAEGIRDYSGAVFHPDGNRVLSFEHYLMPSGVTESSIMLWDWGSGEARLELPIKVAAVLTQVKFSPDGTLFLSRHLDGQLRLYETETGLERFRVPHASELGAFDPKGRRFAAGAGQKTTVWDVATWTLLCELPGVRRVNDLDFSPDGERLLTASADGTSRIWDAETGRPLTVPLVHEDPISSAEFSPDGTLVLTASWDGTARVWDAGSGQLLSETVRHGERLIAAHFDPHGHRFLTVAPDAAQWWNCATGKPIGPPIRPGWRTHEAVLSPDGKHMATMVGLQGVELWRTMPGQPRAQIFRHEERLNRGVFARLNKFGAFAKDGRQIITGGLDGMVRVWNRRSGEPLAALPAGLEAAAVDISSDGSLLLTASVWNGGVKSCGAKLYDANTFDHIRDIVSGQDVGYAEFSPGVGEDGAYRILTGISGGGSGARIWNAKTGKAESGLITDPLADGIATVSPALNLASYSPDGRYVVVCPGGTSAWVCDGENGELIRKLEGTASQPGHSALVDCGAFSPDGTRIVTCGDDGTARVWETATGRQVGRPLSHSEEVVRAEFDPHGRRVVTVSVDGTARIWDAVTGEPVGLPLRHAGGLLHASFDPDGRRVVTTSLDWTGRVWDAETGLPLSEPLRHDGLVIHASFSPDGNQVLTSGDDTTSRLWEVPPAPGGLVPEWVAAWAEAVVGVRLGEDDTIVHLGWEERQRIQAAAVAGSGNDLYRRTARWFNEDLATRTISPHSEMTLGRYVANRIREGTRGSLEEALRVSPENADAMAGLAGLLVRSGGAGDAGKLRRAEYYARQVLANDPGNRPMREVVMASKSVDERALIAVLVPPNSDWKWLHTLDGDPATLDSDFHSTFMSADYDDTSWQIGADAEGATGGFGYGDDWFEGVDIGNDNLARYSAYFRHRFTTTEVHQHLELHCQRDDGIIIYLDGVEVGSDNMSAGAEAYRLPAIRTVGGAAETTTYRIPLTLRDDGLPPGEHVLAISLHNTTKPSTDLRIGGITLVAVAATD